MKDEFGLPRWSRYHEGPFRKEAGGAETEPGSATLCGDGGGPTEQRMQTVPEGGEQRQQTGSELKPRRGRMQHPETQLSHSTDNNAAALVGSL